MLLSAQADWLRCPMLLKGIRWMLEGLIILLLFQLIGEVLARAAHLPLPGPVIGMLLLFGVLLMRGGIPPVLQCTATRLLHYLSLLFVPAGVGIMAYGALLRSEWLPVLVTLALSLIITLSVTALTLAGLVHISARLQQHAPGAGGARDE